ncbi:hypothetical protein MXD81_49515 [Microbacteriaceae bacterium K1510]|nr:hypothetical protein [Microbacteriaceae bacterium K1510]
MRAAECRIGFDIRTKCNAADERAVRRKAFGQSLAGALAALDYVMGDDDLF